MFALAATAVPVAAGAEEPAAAPSAKGKPTDQVVVTATRREELAQRVPVALTAVTGDQIERTRVADLDDLSAIVPGPTFIPISGASQALVQIRGTIGGSDDSPAFDTPVAMFIDDLYYGSVSNFYPDFFDAAQVTILRGPQGTAFGRNVVGGAIQVTSNRPQFENSGKVSATVLNRPGFESEGFYNGMLSDKFATRVAYSVKLVDGYNRNVVTGKDLDDKKMWAVRWSNRFQPSDVLDVNLIASWSHEDSLGPGFRYFGQGHRVAEVNALPKFRQVLQDTDGTTKKDMWSVALHVDWDIGFATFSSVTGYRGLDQFFEKDEDGYSFNFNDDKIDVSKEEQFSQELRLTSPSDRTVEWLVGFYYLYQDIFRSEDHGFGGPPGSLIAFLLGGADGLANGARQYTQQNQTTKVNSFAAYAEVIVHATDWLTGRAGVRYTYDHKRGSTVHTQPSRFFGAAFDLPWENSWDKVTPRFSLEFTPIDDIMIYASATSGFKSGGYSFSAPTVSEALTPLEPESAWSYEIGAKTSLFDKRVQLNATAFLMDTRNLQVRTLQNGVLFQSNAGKTRNKGIEVELTANPVDEFFIGVNYNYIDAIYSEFVGCTAGGVDCTGNLVPFTPKQTLGLFAQNTWTIGNSGALTLRAEYKYQSSYRFNATNDEPAALVALTRRDTFINLFLSYTPPSEAWELSLWARNIANDKAVTFAPNYAFFMHDLAETQAGLNQAWRLSYTEPRSFGVTFTYRFD
ncbi:MAG: TonB-dependent receptor [Sphingomonadales bacterium]